MAQLSARQIALKALRTWRNGKCFADSIITELFANTELAPSDRAFALKLFYGVLRNLTMLDFWIGCLRASRIESDLRDILRLGLYQLFLLKTAQHAAVHETVSLAPKRQRAIINAMLRGAATLPEVERNKNAQEIWKLAVEQVWSIGLVGQSPN